ncbi:PAP2-domain-containing protein [Metschnikowia bicuspidata var. bicuspidata NRRL YB-4993]|uniref:PAP2-domain-containing protein n=1 Tax=Metschnikowia bicuspidata var. bicuspidata NRRL YB-4993 TaxID=869754 RepID=A0A1A0HG39_9ASCO|nr:PAP2-domain-containing protein [Metschnikowia bicuspidata var. bicuspidata NRRL YB-4993]OBA22966.1 PAP2-domain-containing protein [Metschnikowia bicuspidata var. bicuspidata NRRL YB-4993]
MYAATYLSLNLFRRYLPDWITTGVMFAYFFLVAEHAMPFNRQFKLEDATLQHPFTVAERVPGVTCLVLATVVPALVIAVVTFSKHAKTKSHAWHVFQISLLGLALTVSVDGVVTDILKCWVGRPRPDFLARCGPMEGTPVDQFVDISVCTAPLGMSVLADGMRSTPSGHSSISFSAFLYLAMWIYGQFQLTRRPRDIHLHLLAALPLLLASYVALSRVQDYRHHFVDIFLGGILGCTIAYTMYHKYFHPVSSLLSHEVLGAEDDKLLPL